MKNEKYRIVDELAYYIAKYNIPDNQMRNLIDVISRKGIEQGIRALHIAVSRGLMPPMVASYIEEKILYTFKNPREIAEILSLAYRLADYTFVKPFIEWSDIIEKEVKLSKEDILNLEVIRERNAITYNIRVSPTAPYIDRSKLTNVLRKLLREKLNIKNINLRIHITK